MQVPLGKFIVITGVSGSGKSSLAFDTLYAEGQRRYVESLSSYARQFLGRMSKPEVDYIKGLPPAIAVEQKVKTRSSRSTVGTSTEIHDYLRRLFARIGKTISPVSGEEVKKHQVKDVLDYMASLSEGTMLMLLAPMRYSSATALDEGLEVMRQQGFNRVLVGDEVLRFDSFSNMPERPLSFDLVIDRCESSRENAFLNRMADSVETAFYEGDGVCKVCLFDAQRKPTEFKEFSIHFEADGIRFEEPTEALFSFNSPLGACPECEGFGSVIGIDESLVVPNKALSVYEGAVVCWRGEKMGAYRDALIMSSEQSGFPIHTPYCRLSEKHLRMLWDGCQYFEGINDFFKFVEANQYKIQYRVMLSRYRGRTVCPKCRGSRLRNEALYVKVGGKNIHELSTMTVGDLIPFFEQLQLNEFEQKAASKLLAEIINRLHYLDEVGLSYLTLNRLSNTLSGGESQRINLATSLGSSLVGSMYMLDEPSIGLHTRDTERLIGVLRKLQQLGNTIVVVEHDEKIMRSADWLIDIGPGAGRLGGQVVVQGDPKQLLKHVTPDTPSVTLRYLAGLEQFKLPESRRSSRNYIEIKGATEHNLKQIDVKIPLNVITVVTGVSGSGKSSLVRDVLYNALLRHFGEGVEYVGSFMQLSGSLHLISGVEWVDQNPIGKSSRSNPATYLKAFDEIRRLFASQQLAKQMGYTAGHFSFNAPGGRCETCQGEGVVTVPMQFMADVRLTCDDCHGRRFKSDVLDVKYRGKSIYDILEMTINQALEFFEGDAAASKVVKRLLPLQQVGLGYLKMGQSSSTLSGGENQRVKLASFLVDDKVGHKLFMFDEPTTGLHFSDIKTLMNSFNRLMEQGHTVLIVEHNLDVIRSADYVIELGPEGGDAGGRLVFAGTPEELKKCDTSQTGRYV